jgi:hypothetical protein
MAKAEDMTTDGKIVSRLVWEISLKANVHKVFQAGKVTPDGRWLKRRRHCNPASADPEQFAVRSMQPFKTSFGDADHFSDLHPGTMVARNHIGLHDDGHIFL